MVMSLWPHFFGPSCIFVNSPTQELQKITEAVASTDQNLPTEQTHFLSTSGRLWTTLIFNKRCNERRSNALRKQ